MSLKVVYHDERYPSSWINQQWSANITSYLNNRGFDIKNADELRDWIRLKLTHNECPRSVIIFSQDKVPDTILGPHIPNVPIRTYLDDGGRVVWIGDIPFWSKASSTTQTEELWRSGAHFALLGVQPLIGEASTPSKWLVKWENILQSRWYSQRPIAIDLGKEFKSLSQLGLVVWPMAYSELTLLPVSWNTTVITRWRKAGVKIGGFGIDFPYLGGIKTEIIEKYPEELSLKPIRLPVAWHIIFNNEYSYQGFYRFWDTGSTEALPPSTLLYDIHQIATHRL